jgi:hypothetical protein
MKSGYSTSFFRFQTIIGEGPPDGLFRRHIAALPDGQMLMKQDGECRFVPMVISGILRVYKLSPNGREMTLYRSVPETHVLSPLPARSVRRISGSCRSSGGIADLHAAVLRLSRSPDEESRLERFSDLFPIRTSDGSHADTRKPLPLTVPIVVWPPGCSKSRAAAPCR